MASSEGGYNPMSYHCGSVWPHDNAIVAAGLCRYGFWNEAQAVFDGLLDAAMTGDGALPELFCGIDRADVPVPVWYPTSCRPQAWAAGAPLMMLRALLGLEPDGAGGLVTRAGRLAEHLLPLRWSRVAVGQRRVDVIADAAGCHVVEAEAPVVG
jgi:glycogen debranching enzyme